MSNPRLSIITVCFNALPDLRKTADSLYKLKGFFDYEWIVIDGGSRDGTQQFMQSLRWPNTRFVSEPDKGIYNAMNKGLAMANGHWLWFVNAGDTMQPALLEGQPWNHSSPVLFISCRDNGRVVKVRPFGMPYCHQGMLFKNGTGIKYDEQYKISADYDFLLKYLKRGRRKVSDVPLTKNGQYIDADVSGLNRQKKSLRDTESFSIAWKHKGVGLHLFFYAGLVSYRLFEKLFKPKRNNELGAIVTN